VLIYLWLQKGCLTATLRIPKSQVLGPVTHLTLKSIKVNKLIHILSNGPDKKERTKRNEHVQMQKGAIFTVVSTTFLIGLNIKFYEIFAKQHVY